jgi:D-glycerate 3-kinase
MNIALLFQRLAEDSSIENTISTLYHSEAIAALIDLELQNPSRANAFNIRPDTAEDAIIQRLELLQSVYFEFVQLCEYLKLSPLPIESLWSVWLPLSIQIGDWRVACCATPPQSQKSCPLIQGFLGGQGVGKTTLTKLLTLILRHLGHQTISFSLDDLYLPYRDRLQLQQHDPRLIRRGPPGTHDLELGLRVLQQLRQNQFPVAIPQFDKSAFNGAGDRTAPILVTEADIVLFEGWFVGVPPIDPSSFEAAPAPIVTERDRQFARDMNEQLRDYLPLWHLLDRLIVLYSPNYQLSKQWRKQAEHKMINQGKVGMIDSEIDDFVEYFWKALHPQLFLQPLLKDSDRVSLILEINPDHQPGAIYTPSFNNSLQCK